MDSHSGETLLHFTAGVLIKPEGAESIPRASQSQGRIIRWTMHYNVYYGYGPPPADRGMPSDLYFQGCDVVYYRGRHEWVEWNGVPGAKWPQDPDNLVQNTINHRLIYSKERGLYWGSRSNERRVLRQRAGEKWGQGGPSNRIHNLPPIAHRRAIVDTVTHWAKHFNRNPGGNAHDVERIARRVSKATSADMDEDEDGQVADNTDKEEQQVDTMEEEDEERGGAEDEDEDGGGGEAYEHHEDRATQPHDDEAGDQPGT